MQIGLHALGIGTGAVREVIDAVAIAAESRGFSTLWVGEHVVAVDEPSSRYPYSADGRIAVPSTTDWNDPMITLAFIAAATSTIGLATGVLLLAEHNPVVMAKKAATLDRLSLGRLTLGVGVGWSREEFDALGVPFAARTARTAEYVAVMRQLWREPVASYDGRFVRFSRIRVNPKPSDGTQISIVLGGNTDAALARIAEWGDGWYGFNLDTVAAVAERLAFLDACCKEAGRDPTTIRRAVALRDPHPVDLPGLAQAGLEELVIVASPPADPARARDWVHVLADEWIGPVDG